MRMIFITILLCANAFAESWMTIDGFNQKEGVVYKAMDECMAQESKYCIQVDGKDMDILLYEDGSFVEDAVAKALKASAAAEAAAEEAQRAAAEATCRALFASMNPDAVQPGEVPAVLRCASSFLLDK